MSVSRMLSVRDERAGLYRITEWIFAAASIVLALLLLLLSIEAVVV